MNAPHAKHLKELKEFLADSAVCRESFSLLVHLAARLAAAGHAAKILGMIEDSPEEEVLRPLADGLRMHLGMAVEREAPAYEMAREIAGRIGEDVAA